jgi:hypothetical protein
VIGSWLEQAVEAISGRWIDDDELVRALVGHENQTVDLASLRALLTCILP